jgi:hypothetical protein
MEQKLPSLRRTECKYTVHTYTYIVLFSQLDLNVRKKLVKCCIWCIALHGAETWTLRKVDQKYTESFVSGVGEGWRRSVGPIV